MLTKKVDEVDGFNKVLKNLEIVLETTLNPENHKRLKDTLEFLKSNTTTVQVGNSKVTIISPEVVPVNPVVTVEVVKSGSDDEQNYVDTAVVAEYFGVTAETVRNWIKDKKISGHQMSIRGKYLIPKEEFEYLKSKRNSDDTEEVMRDVMGEDYSEEWEVEIEE